MIYSIVSAAYGEKRRLERFGIASLPELRHDSCVGHETIFCENCEKVEDFIKLW